MYKVLFRSKVAKDLKVIPRVEIKNIFNKGISFLKETPFPNGYNPKKLKGTSKLRHRVGNYRIVYEILENTVIIFRIAHRKDIYR